MSSIALPEKSAPGGCLTNPFNRSQGPEMSSADNDLMKELLMSMVVPCVRVAVVVIILASLCVAGDLPKVATNFDRAAVPPPRDDRLAQEASGLEMRRPYERGKVP